MVSCIGIIARLNSKRLKNKHLLQVNNKPILSYLIERIKFEFQNEIDNNLLEISLLTGNEKDNKDFINLVDFYKIRIFFGNNDNVLLRIHENLKINKYTSIICVEGDDILCSVKGMRQIYESLKKNSKDIVKTRSYPFGMNSLGFTFEFINRFFNKENLSYNKSIWKTSLERDNKVIFVDNLHKWDNRLRFTLDYPDDLKFFNEIINSNLNIKTAKDKEIIDHVIGHEVYKFNSHLIADYWKNYNHESKNDEIK